MRHASFLKALLLTLALLVLANVGVRRISRNSVPRQLLRRLETVDRPIHVVALGNSVVQAGFDVASFEAATRSQGAGMAAFNAGLGASGPIPARLLGRAALRSRAGARLLIYGGIDLFFTDQTRQPWLWTTHSGNKALVFYCEPELAAGYLDTTSWGRLAFAGASWVPMYVERSTPWAKVESLRRQLGSWGLPLAAVNTFGRVEDFQSLVSHNVVELAARSVAAQESLSPPVRDLLVEATGRNVRVCVVLMPLHPSRHSRLATPEWRAYAARLRSLLAEYGAGLINASDWIADEQQFSDILHLHPTGAAAFSGRLAAELPAAGFR